MKRGFVIRRFRFVIAGVSVLAGLSVSVIGCASLCKPKIDDFDEGKRQAAYKAYYEDLAPYFQVIMLNDPTLIDRIPKKTVNPMGYPPKTLLLRRNAADFFRRTKGRALVSSQWRNLAALEPDKLFGGVLNNPAELVVWHNTGHYSGVSISIEDDNGRVLADSSMPEISHYQDILHRDEIKMACAEPTAPEGSVKMYAWSLESSSSMPKPFLEMRVKFADYKSDKWKNISAGKLKTFFESFRLYNLAISLDYRPWLRDMLSDNIPDPLTGAPVYFRKSIVDAGDRGLDFVWQYGPLMAIIEPYNPQGLLSNPAHFDIWHNSGYDARFALIFADDKKNILAEIEMPALYDGFPGTLRREEMEIKFKKPSARTGKIQLCAFFPYAGAHGTKKILKEYPIKFTR